MGSLSNLYISQSYTSLIHLGSDGTITTQSVALQDGLGNSLGITVNSLGDLNVNGFTASLQQGYVYVGNNTGKTTTVSTASFGSSASVTALNQFTASQNTKNTTLELYTASVNISLSNINNFTASNGNTSLNQFTASQNSFNASATASILALQNFSSSLDITYVTQTELANATGSLINQIDTKLNTSSFNQYTASTNIRLNNLETTSASVNISISNLNSITASQATSISNLNQYTQSNNTQWTDLMNHSSSWVTTAITASSLITASFDTGTRNLIFTKGNSQTFNVNIPDVSGSNAYTTTSSFNEFTASTNQFTASATISINALNQFTSSQTSINSGVQVALAGKLNTSSFESYTSSVNSDLTSIHSTTASLNLATASFSSSINQLNIFTASQSTASIVSSITNLNSFTSSANNRLNNLETTSASVNISITNINSTTASQAISITNLNQFSQSAQSSINSLNAATSSYAISSSVAAVDAAQQSQINSLIAATGSYLTSSVPLTSLNAFTASQLTINSGYNTFTSSANQRLSSLETNSASVNISISALNTFTASQSTASIVSSITNLNTFTASAQISINALNTNSASVNTSISNLNTTTASLNSSITQLNASSASQQISINAINAASSSWITESETGSFAYINKDNSWSANQTFTNITAISASFQYVQTLYETASVIYSSGSNQFGDELSDIQTLSGSVKVQGSLTVNGTPVLTSSADVTGFVTTSSFNAYTSSNNQRVSSLETNSASVNISISNINSTTASLNSSVSNLNQFSASNLISINALNTNSASVNSSITNLNQFTASQSTASIVSSIDNLNQFTASQSTASIVSSIDNLNQFSASTLTRLTNIETTTASLNSSITNINSFTQSANQRIGSLEAATSSYVTSAITASTLVTASFDNGTRNLTFTKGDASTFAVNIPDVSGSNIPDGTISSSAQITSLGFVSSSITASSLVTASVNLNTITFTKGDASTFNITVNTGSGGGGSTDLTSLNSFTQSQYVSNSYFATTGSNTFRGSQTFNQTNTSDKITINGDNATIYLELDPAPSQTRLKIANPSNPVLRFVTNQTINPLYDISVTGTGNTGSLYIGTADNAFVYAKYTDNGLTNLYNKVDLSGSLSITGSLTASLTQGYAWVGNANNISTLVSTSSFGGGGTTYINPTLNPYSGSLILVANTFTSSSFAHISASANGQVNLAFKNNNNTADTIISGSNNLFVNATAPTAGFKRYIGGSGNIMLNAGTVPQISSSMAFSPTMSNNFFNSAAAATIMRGPISSSTWTLSNNIVNQALSIGNSAANNAEKAVSGVTCGNNIFNSSFSIIANRSLLTQALSVSNNQTGFLATTLNAASSSIQYTGNFGGGITITNSASGSATAIAGNVNTIYLVQNTFAGSNNTITASGSSDPGDISGTSYLRQIEQNQIFGTNNGVNLPYAPTGSNSLGSTMIAGYSLGVTGSNASSFSTLAINHGSAFFGRYNALDGNRAQSAQTIFAVGTGTSTSNRKTGFLIDSGSNTFIEGTFNVSGSTRLSGSIVLAGETSFINLNGNDSNVILGARAMGNISGTVATSIAIGDSAMRYADGTANNTAIGANTLQYTIGANNVALGKDVLTNNTLGSQNIGIGTSALNKNTTGGQNTILGYEAGYNNVTGSANTYLGYTSGKSISGSYNVILGSYQGSGETLNNNIIFADGQGNVKAQYSGSNWTLRDNVLVSGSLYIKSGSTLPSATGSSILTWNATTEQVAQSTFATLISSSLSAGAFYNGTTLSGSAGVSQSIDLPNTTLNSSGITIQNNSQILVSQSGTYNLQFSAQLDAFNNADTVWIWFKKNGINITNSASKLIMQNNTAAIMTVNIFDNAAAGDYYEVVWQNNAGHIKVTADAATGNIPAVPSLIVTINQVK